MGWMLYDSHKQANSRHTPEARLPSDGLQGGGDCKTPRRQVPAQDFYHISFGAIEC